VTFTSLLHRQAAAGLRRLLLSVVAMITLLLVAAPDRLAAAPGDLDPSFDFDGKQTIGGLTGIAGAKLLEQPDGKIVVIGRAGYGTLVGAVARLHPDGSPDTSFGDGGHTIVDIGGVASYFGNGAIQPDGKIVLVGTAYDPNGSLDWALARVDEDGVLDPGFGTGGMVRQALPHCCNEGFDVVILASGKILVTGSDSPHLVVARYNSNGTLDSAFGVDPTHNISTVAGMVQTEVGTVSSARALALQSDGKILVGGSTRLAAGGEVQSVVVRYDEDGVLDTSFGTGCHAVLSLAGDDIVREMAIQADDKIVLVGSSLRALGYTEAYAARLEAEGDLDTSFSGSPAEDLTGTDDGVWVYDRGENGSGNQWFDHVAVDGDGNLLVLGLVGDCGSCHVLSKLLVNGSTDGHLDTSFVDDLNDTPGHLWPSGMVGARLILPGVLITNPEDMLLLSTGKILVLGGVGNRYPLARFDADGGADTSFDLPGDDIGPGNGRVNVTFQTTSDARALVVDMRGEVFLAGSAHINGDSRLAVEKYSCDGSFPSNFFSDQVRNTFDVPGGSEGVADMAIQPDGRIVMVGNHTPPGSPVDVFVLARFNPWTYPRVLDSSFGTGGWVKTDVVHGHDVARAVAIQPDGKIVVAGSSSGQTVVARYNPSGSLDSGFAPGGADGDGIASFDLGTGADYAAAVALLPGGKILLGGTTESGGDFDLAVLRLNADGSLDSSFDGDGIVTHALASDDVRVADLAVGADGSIALVGDIAPDALLPAQVARDLLVVRLEADGSLDSGFDGDGWLRQEVLGEDDGTAVAMGYAADHTTVDTSKWTKKAGPDGDNQKCTTCALYQKVDDEYGLCPIFAGKRVHANGWCNGWVPK